MKILPLSESAAYFYPADLLHGVKVMFLLSKPGARTLYHSFLMKGWALYSIYKYHVNKGVFNKVNAIFTNF